MKISRLTPVLLLPIFSLATITFERTYGDPTKYETGYAVQTTSDGGYAVIGCATTGRDIIYFIKADSVGNPMWSTLVSQGYVHKNSYSFKELNDSGFICVGYMDSILGTAPAEVYLVRFNSFGDTIWSRLYGGDSLDRGYWVEITPDSNFIIAGQTKSYGMGSSDVWLIKTDTSGTVLWNQTYGGTGYDMGRCVKNTPDKGFIIVGSTYSFGAGFRDIYLIKTDSLGVPSWSQAYGGSGYEWGYDVEHTVDNGYIIVGSTNSFGAWGLDIYLIKTDSLGNPLWTKTYGGILDDVGHSVVVTNDGSYVIAGYTNSYGAGRGDVWLIKTDSMSNIIWTKQYGGVKDDWAYAVERTQDNGYVITGFTSSMPGDTLRSDMYLIKTDSLGNAGIEEFQTDIRKKDFLVLRIHPNPFTQITNITLPADSWQDAVGCMEIYDIAGRRCRHWDGSTIRHTHCVTWDGRDELGNILPSGVYFVQLKVGEYTIVEKLILIR